MERLENVWEGLEEFPSGECNPYLSDEHAHQLARHLRALAPAEIVALHNYLDERAINDTCKDDAKVEWPEEESAIYGYLTDAITLLPQHDVKFARAVYTAYAASPDHINRGFIGTHISRLVATDHKYGLNLWDRLIRDAHDGVRYNTYGALLGHAEALEDHDYDRADAELTKLGISWREARQLLDAYADADRGERVFRLGEMALQRVLEATEQQQNAD